jgi:restriction system protein
MARTSLVDDIFDLLSKAPWWLGVGAAAAFWIGGMFAGRPDPQGDLFKTAIAPIFRFFLDALAVVSLIAAAFSAVRQLKRRKLLDRQNGLQSLRSLSWREFEQLVGEAYRRQGYDVEETGGGGADGGIDLVLRGHGETVLVQCKQWRVQQVGVEKVRELFGVLHSEGADRGILVTSGTFTREAQSFKVGKPLVLVDGPALAALVRGVRSPAATAPTVQPSHRPPVPPPPSNRPSAQPSDPLTCPKCGAPMTLRTAKRGNNAGNSFYGCTRYPDCKGIRNT